MGEWLKGIKRPLGFNKRRNMDSSESGISGVEKYNMFMLQVTMIRQEEKMIIQEFLS